MSIYTHIQNFKLSLSNQTELSKPKNKIIAYFIPLSWMDFIADVTKNETTESLEIQGSHVMIAGKKPIQIEPVDQDVLKKIISIISYRIPETHIGEIYFSIPQTAENIELFSLLRNSRGILLIDSHNSGASFFQLGSEGIPLNFKNMHIDSHEKEFKVSLGSSFPTLPFYQYLGCFPIPGAV